MGDHSLWAYLQLSYLPTPQVLRTLSYQNGYTNNSVTDGRRTIAIVAEDTLGVRSGVMYIVTNIFVMDRNDGPDVNLGKA